MKPVYQILTYTGTTLDHTITDDAVSIGTSERLTESIGTFTITLPSERYKDIAVFDKIKIYLGYDSLPATPTFVGRVNRNEGLFDAKGGYQRKITGVSQGEVLLRRLLCSHYSGVDASVIVSEFATALGLGTSEIVTEATEPNLEFVDQTYFEALQQLSDYWVNAGSQLKKDFYVNPNNDLVWKNRSSYRTANVETFTEGVNILSYVVHRGLENLKNNLTVYGGWDELYSTKNPYDENWTESLTNWTDIVGTSSLDAGDKTEGTSSIKCAAAGGGINWDTSISRTFQPDFAFISGNARSNTKSFSRLHFDSKGEAGDDIYLYLHAPDLGNYYRYIYAPTGGWDTSDLALPTTDAVGIWTAVGTPQANFITYIRWNEHHGAAFDFRVDDLAFQGGRFVYKISDATSIANYGQRDLIVIDDSLKSTTQCESRANTLLYQRKDPTTEIDIATVGNTNVLVGDRLALSLANEDVSGNYYVTSVDHSLSEAGFYTRFMASESLSNRITLTHDLPGEIAKIRRNLGWLGRGHFTMPRPSP